jgi:hypothetical protein
MIPEQLKSPLVAYRPQPFIYQDGWREAGLNLRAQSG